jgi:Fe-S cluster assembly ATP-binding protein
MLELTHLQFTVPAEPPGENREDQAMPVLPIIRDISFTFEPGGFYAITGPNGSGKSTLAKLIMGIHTPSSGEIRFNGQTITTLPIHERAQAGIAYAFQQPARFKGTTFRDLLTIASGSSQDELLAGIISRMGICSMDFLDKPVDAKLSGGEIKKIEMATVIARKPGLAIYDEPDTGIDLWTIAPMVELLKKEQQENQTTTIVVSHNRAFLEAADNLILLKEGSIAYAGDLDGALPLLEDLSVCTLNDFCQGETNADCYR